MQPSRITVLILGLAVAMVAATQGQARIDPDQVAMPTDRMLAGGAPPSKPPLGLSGVINTTPPMG